MDNWTALTAKEVFLPRGKGDQYCYPITDCKEPRGQGQRSKTGFLWIREAAIPVPLKKVQKSMLNREKWCNFDPLLTELAIAFNVSQALRLRHA
jgi:hypothetical protein